MSKKEVLWEAVDHHKPDFIIGCETWLKPTITDNEVLPIGYKIHHKDRADGYGGVLIGIKNNFVFEPLSINTTCEICAVRVKISSSHDDSLILISIYRPPNRDLVYHESLCNAISDIVSGYPRSAIYCAGDINLPDICWTSESFTSHTYPLEMNSAMLNLVNDCGFTQVVNFPTRGPHLLDILFTNRPSLLLQCTHVLGISDHEMIFGTFQTSLPQQKQPKHKIFLWDSGNLDEIRAQLLSFTDYYLSTFSPASPVDELWNTLSSKILDLMNNYIPTKLVQTNVKQTWINHNIKKIRRHKQRLYNKAKSTNSISDWKSYKEAKKQMQQLTRQAFNKYMYRLIHNSYVNGKRKRFYKHIKSL